MPYTERETGWFAGNLSMRFVLAIAGAVVYALIFHIMKTVMSGRLTPWMSLVLAVFGCVVADSLVGQAAGAAVERVAEYSIGLWSCCWHTRASRWE